MVQSAQQYYNRMFQGWDPPSKHPNNYLHAIIASIISSMQMESNLGGSRTELDSHANMCVFGKHCIVVSQSGKTVDVGTFAETAGSLSDVPIVDILIAYDYKRSHQTSTVYIKESGTGG